MAGSHKFQIRLSHKDFFKGDLVLKTRQYRDVPKPTTTLNTDVYYLIESIVEQLRRQAKYRIYTPSIHGSKTAMVKRLVKTAEYWLQAAVDASPWIRMNLRDTNIDPYGNAHRREVLTFDKKHFTVPNSPIEEQVDGRYSPSKVGATYEASGRIIVEISPVLVSSIKIGYFKRLLAKWFPSKMRTSKNKFESTYDIKLRFWVDEFRRFETTMYSLKVSDSIIAPRDPEIEKDFSHDSEDYRRFQRIFRSKGSIRIRRIR